MRYISLLRGINIGGKNIIRMAELRKSIERIGFCKVTTFIQSGNIIFDADISSTDRISEQISELIIREFGLNIQVLTITPDYLERVVEEVPFSGEELDKSCCLFLSDSPETIPEDKIDKYAVNNEKYFYRNRCIYLFCPRGYGRTKLNNIFFEKLLKTTSTARNWKTTTRLLELSADR